MPTLAAAVLPDNPERSIYNNALDSTHGPPRHLEPNLPGARS
jgi:hypothetical protein